MFGVVVSTGTPSSATLWPQPGNGCIPLLSHSLGVPASKVGQEVHLWNLKPIEQCAVCPGAAPPVWRCGNSYNSPGKEAGFHLDNQNFKSTRELGTQEDDLGSVPVTEKNKRALW